MWVTDDSGSLLADAGDLAYMREPLLLQQAPSYMLAGNQDLSQTSHVITIKDYLKK